MTTTQSKFEPYKPPTQRTNQQAQVKKQKVDLHNEEMFPSLGDADKIEKQQTDDQKKQRVEEKSASPAVERYVKFHSNLVILFFIAIKRYISLF